MAFAPQKVQIKRTSTDNNPPSGLLPGELSVEMGIPLRLWVGVPTEIDNAGKKLLVPQPAVFVGDGPPAVPTPNLLWWESDTGILWLWYNDGGTTQWVQVSNSGAKAEDVVTDADEVAFQPGGSLSADDVQEALMELDQEKVAKAGDTMTGFLTLNADPTAPMQAATKQYVDAADLVLQTSINNKLGDAPNDGRLYGRTNLAWTVASAAAITFTPGGNVAATNVQTAIAELDTEKVGEAPNDGQIYGRKDTTWVLLEGDIFEDAPSDGVVYGRSNAAWVAVSAGGGGGTTASMVTFTPAGDVAATNVQNAIAELDDEKLSDAPADGLTYGRKDGLWVVADTGCCTAAETPFTPAGTIESADVQAAIEEVGAKVDLKVYRAGDTMTGNLTISKNAPAILLRKSASGQYASIGGMNGVNLRWEVQYGSSEAESGSNAGSNFIINRHSDAGALLGAALTINRATGLATITGDPTAALGVATKQYVDARDVALTGKIPVAFPFSGKPGASTRVNVPIAIASTIAAGLSGSLAYASIATTADAVFTVNKISGGSTVAVGTVTMKVTGVHVFAGAGAIFVAGDILQVIAPATQDGTLADVGITLLMTRS